MDITSLFKACVKTARLKNKALPADKAKPVAPEKRQLAQNVPPSSDFKFAEKTRTICQQLTQLRDCLLENRSAYMKFGCHLKGVAQRMTDQERDVIDAETDKILTICTQLIIELRQEAKRAKTHQQNAEYMENVLESLTTYLKNVFGISNQMRTYRVKKELETYKMLKLKADKRDIPETPKVAKKRDQEADEGQKGLRRRRRKKKGLKDGDEEEEEDQDQDREDLLGNSWDRKRGNRSDEEQPDDEYEEEPEVDANDDNYDSGTDTGDFISNGHNLGSRPLSHTESTSRKSIPMEQSYILEEEEVRGHANDMDLSPEDVQMFEQENRQLLSELKGLSEEISQIEKNVTEIAKLQDLFTEKVTLQQSDIDRISNTVVGVTENVKDANDQIREAIQRNAGLRVYILFFLLVMSFSLLFLHWYND